MVKIPDIIAVLALQGDKQTSLYLQAKYPQSGMPQWERERIRAEFQARAAQWAAIEKTLIPSPPLAHIRAIEFDAKQLLVYCQARGDLLLSEENNWQPQPIDHNEISKTLDKGEFVSPAMKRPRVFPGLPSLLHHARRWLEQYHQGQMSTRLVHEDLSGLPLQLLGTDKALGHYLFTYRARLFVGVLGSAGKPKEIAPATLMHLMQKEEVCFVSLPMGWLDRFETPQDLINMAWHGASAKDCRAQGPYPSRIEDYEPKPHRDLMDLILKSMHAVRGQPAPGARIAEAWGGMHGCAQVMDEWDENVLSHFLVLALSSDSPVIKFIPKEFMGVPVKVMISPMGKLATSPPHPKVQRPGR